MLSFKDHKIIINHYPGIIEIWDDERNAYEKHSFEFIEDLYDLIQKAKKDLVQPKWDGGKPPVVKT